MIDGTGVDRNANLKMHNPVSCENGIMLNGYKKFLYISIDGTKRRKH